MMNDAAPSQSQQQQLEDEVEEQEPEELENQGYYALEIEYQEQVEYHQVEDGQRQLTGEAESVRT